MNSRGYSRYGCVALMAVLLCGNVGVAQRGKKGGKPQKETVVQPAMQISEEERDERLREVRDLMDAGRDSDAQEILENLRTLFVPEADMYLGRIAFRNYDFALAQQLYGKYAKTVGETKTMAPYAEYVAQLAEAEKQIGRVENITILDSIVVPFDDFYRYYRLPKAAGRLLMPKEIPNDEAKSLASMAFSNDAGNFLMWSQPDSLGTLRIVESERLSDGTWTSPKYTPAELNGGGDADFPFLSTDGSMLYFAANGDGSIGGMDIYMASRDPRTGEYMRPTNMGMPINSPYDDYMLAVDEENGVGWWATDRQRLDNALTLYIYRLPELRENISAEADVVSRARIDNVRDSWGLQDLESDTVDYAEAVAANRAIVSANEALLAKVRANEANDSHSSGSIAWRMPDGRVYRTLADFSNDQVRRRVVQYIDMERKQTTDMAELKTMRAEYHSNPDAMSGELIRELELTVAQRRDKMKRLRSEIYRLESEV